MFGKKKNRTERDDKHTMMLILASARINKIDVKVMAKEMLNIKDNVTYLAEVTLESLKQRKEEDDKEIGAEEIDEGLKETMKHILELGKDLKIDLE